MKNYFLEIVDGYFVNVNKITGFEVALDIPLEDDARKYPANVGFDCTIWVENKQSKSFNIVADINNAPEVAETKREIAKLIKYYITHAGSESNELGDVSLKEFLTEAV